jgi:hypothetical protein
MCEQVMCLRVTFVHIFFLSLELSFLPWGFLGFLGLEGCGFWVGVSLSLFVCVFFVCGIFGGLFNGGGGKMEIYRGESFFVERCWLVGLGYKARDIVV